MTLDNSSLAAARHEVMEAVKHVVAIEGQIADVQRRLAALTAALVAASDAEGRALDELARLRAGEVIG